MKKEILMSQAGMRSMEQELEYLKAVRRKEVAQKIKTALSFGDLSENSEYDEAKNDQAMLEGRISYLEKTLTNVRVIDVSELNTDNVCIGCTVKIKDVETGEYEDYSIVSSNEANASQGKISDESPMGKAMMGKSVGENFDVVLPSGYKMKFEVVEIGKQNL
ncbi:MAG: transcription elongation factor GreA [Ruminococcaceae bacterium]|nr:transcription elongation factor GreA [Oscillospiraceae bacterium]